MNKIFFVTLFRQLQPFTIGRLFVELAYSKIGDKVTLAAASKALDETMDKWVSSELNSYFDGMEAALAELGETK